MSCRMLCASSRSTASCLLSHAVSTCCDMLLLSHTEHTTDQQVCCQPREALDRLLVHLLHIMRHMKR